VRPCSSRSAPERLDHLVDLPGRDAGQYASLHVRDERLLAALVRLQKRRQVAAAAELRDRQLELALPRLPLPRPIAVAVRQPLPRPLAALGTDQLRRLRLHQLLHDPGERLAQEIQALALKQLADDLVGRHPLRIGHRGDSPLVVVFAGLDESERHGGRTNYPAPSDALLHHATGRDPSGPSEWT
jgi:hypothetical protein